MPNRAYLVLMSGGSAPASLGGSSAWSGHALPATGWGLAIADVTPVQHTTLVADVANITYLPFEDTVGGLVPLSGTWQGVSAANRTLVTSRLEAQHVPMNGWVATDELRNVMIRAIRRFLLRQLLGPDDWTEGLDTTVSQIPVAKRTNITTKLEAHGYDMSLRSGTDTIREDIRRASSQMVRMSRTGVDS